MIPRKPRKKRKKKKKKKLIVKKERKKVMETLPQNQPKVNPKKAAAAA